MGDLLKTSPQLCSVELCSGCTACAMACPSGAISMIEDSEGFTHPVVNHLLCTYCLVCEKTCPILHQPEPQSPLMVYAAVNLNNSVRLNSSSGGVFTALARQILAVGGIVYGAGWSDSLSVVHKSTDNEAGLEDLRSSKYVQSDLGDTFRKIKTCLENKRKVLFCGTPCQVAGLRSFLRGETENLVCVDFICHAVPSPLIFLMYKKELERLYRGRIIKIRFRDKRWGWSRFALHVVFDNGREYYGAVDRDMYLQGFLRELYNRPSCHKCQFKNLRSGSDLTLADFWGVEKEMPEMSDNLGTSLVLVNSPKGGICFGQTAREFQIKEVEYEIVKQTNPPLIQCVQAHCRRKHFFGKCRGVRSVRRLILFSSLRLICHQAIKLVSWKRYSN